MTTRFSQSVRRAVLESSDDTAVRLSEAIDVLTHLLGARAQDRYTPERAVKDISLTDPRNQEHEEDRHRD